MSALQTTCEQFRTPVPGTQGQPTGAAALRGDTVSQPASGQSGDQSLLRGGAQNPPGALQPSLATLPPELSTTSSLLTGDNRVRPATSASEQPPVWPVADLRCSPHRPLDLEQNQPRLAKLVLPYSEYCPCPAAQPSVNFAVTPHVLPYLA